ncbi:MAG: hypothetical protein F9K29_17970 [Hyphomicrobiaceae bacterium]|nr:MAG: hypothetical protein F9K29_17970 [Hyphomicrobiaceae bacterium]
MTDAIDIKLTHDEALVLFDFLQREIDLANGARLAAATEHQAELWALNGLNCLLEKVIAEAFRPDYPVLIAAARDALVEKSGTWPWRTSTASEG